MSNTELIVGIISFILTVIVFSYLLGDNFLFRFAMYLLVGITAGYTAALLITNVFIPYVFIPLAGGSIQTRLLTVIPLALCALLLLAIFTKTKRLASIPMAFIVGIAAALTIGGISLGTIIPQVTATIERFAPTLLYQGDKSPWIKIVEAVIMALGVVSALCYFFWGRSKKAPSQNKRPALIEGFGKLGQVFIGITLGALFAGVYSAGLIALISRVSVIGTFFSKLIGN